MSVRLTDEFIEGRDFWGWKRRIPLTDITDLSGLILMGISSTVVSSSRHGEIHILNYTENLSNLIGILETYLPAKKNT
jgi:hypothetical protein